MPLPKTTRADWHADNPWSDANLGRTPTNAEVREGVRWELERKRDAQGARERARFRDSGPIPVPVANLNPTGLWRPSDITQALVDRLEMQARGKLSGGREPHPFVAACATGDFPRRPRMVDFLYSRAIAEGMSPVPEGGRTAARVLALSSVKAGLSNIISSSYQGVVTASFDEVSQDLDAIVKKVPAPNFKEIDYAVVDADGLTKISEAGEIQTGNLYGSAETMQAASFGVNILVTRQEVINDDLGVLVAGIESVSTATARQESRAAIGLLEANDAMGDGAVIFSAEAGNLLTGAALDAGNLDLAIGALRSLPTANGIEANASPDSLLVPSDQEGLARRLVRDMDSPITVRSFPWLNASQRWYLMADPTHWPVLGQATPTWMDNSFMLDPLPEVPPRSMMQTDNGDGTYTLPPGAFDAVAAVRLRRDVGYAIVGRHGVRCEP